MEQDYEVSPILPIGEKNFFCVEYPGYVKRTKRAIESLGGEKVLAEALSSNSNVQLNLRPGDMFSHSIEGQIVPTSKILVKVTRRVKKNETPIWEKEVQGLITNSLRFRGLSDFQYIVPKEDPTYQLKDSLMKGNVQHIMNYKVDMDDDRDNLRNIPPPIFTSIEGMLAYGYRQSAPVLRVRVRQPDGSFKIKLLNRSRTTAIAITTIKYHEENVPTKSWHNLTKPTKPEEKQVIKEIALLFKERPIWSRAGISEYLSIKDKVIIRFGLVHNAYTFSNGPWRDCWIKYGVDPRSDQKYHIYQFIDVRKYTPKTKGTLNDSRKYNAESSKADFIFDGKMIPGLPSSYLLYDITDPEIRSLIDNPAYLKSKPTKYNGFYYACVVNRMRSSIRKKYLSLITTGEPLSLKNLDEGLMEEIEKEIKNTKDNDSDDEEEIEAAAVHENAVRDAMKESKKLDSSKRLKDDADDYMEELMKQKSNADEDEEYDIEYDAIADDDEVFEEDVEENLRTDNTQDEDTIMKEA